MRENIEATTIEGLMCAIERTHSELESLIEAHEILSSRHQASFHSALYTRTNGNGSTSKTFDAAMKLAEHVRDTREDRTINTKEAGDFLLEHGLTSEKSRRFHVWQVLNAGGLFVREERGLYRLAAADPVASTADD